MLKTAPLKPPLPVIAEGLPNLCAKPPQFPVMGKSEEQMEAGLALLGTQTAPGTSFFRIFEC
jgi:hypothetical protein